jgi:hypothetical protein
VAKFLTTTGTNYRLEELIKGASDRLILISPFLKLNDRMKELLADKNRLKIDVRIVYGKSELQPQEIEWLRSLTYIRTSFCKNLVATLGIKTAQFLDRATELGYLALDGGKHLMTPKGEKAGVEFVAKSRFGPYFLWPQDFQPV